MLGEYFSHLFSEISNYLQGNCTILGDGKYLNLFEKIFLIIYFLNWRIIALQNFVVFCHISARISHQFSSVQSLSRVRLFVTPWTAARQASLFITISRSSLRLLSIESMMPSIHLIIGRPLLLLPPIPPSIRVFSNESTLPMRWPKYWSFSFSIIRSKEIPGLISFRMDWHI